MVLRLENTISMVIREGRMDEGNERKLGEKWDEGQTHEMNRREAMEKQHG